MKLKIIKASRYFKVFPYNDVAKKICRFFQTRYIHKTFSLDGDAPIKLYATALSDESEFRFHINTFNQFKNYLNECLVKENDFILEEKPLPDIKKRNIKVKKSWTIRDYQEPIINYLVSPTPVNKFIGIQTGKGKSTALKELVKIPGGWKKMGDIQLGDDVIAKDGSTTKVTGVFPQGKMQLYRVTFADGRHVDCCAEHLWRVYYINTTPHKRWRVVNTLEVLRLISMPNPRVYIDLCDSEDCHDVILPMDPYLLGVFLGDGCSRATTPTISTPDEYIVNEVRKVLHKNLCLVKYKQFDEQACPTYGIVTNKAMTTERINTFTLNLILMGLNKKVSHEKFIPDEYFHASKKQRLSLLQGLLDTDGTVNTVETGGSVSFCSSSLALSKGVQYLVRSLGGIASIGIRQPTYTYKGEKKAGRQSYDVNIRYKKPSELFRLPKKKERTNDNNQYATDLKLRVMSVVPSGIEEAQCISIDHPDKLYVTTDFIVTHNTFCSLYGVAALGYRTIVIVEGGLVSKWASDILKVLDIKANRTLCVRGGSQLRGLIGMAGTKELENIDIILLSSTTLQDWITLHEVMATSLEKSKDIGYGIEPDEFYEKLEIGHRLIDEVHKKFHFNYKQDLYTNTHLVTSLSATLFSYDKLLESFYEIAYPIAERYKAGEIDKYANSTAVIWELQRGRRVRTKNHGRSSYSHNVFEESIMRYKDAASKYFEMVSETLDIGFIKNYKKGNKAAVYVASIDMATKLTEYLRKRFPDKSVERYVGSLNDPYANLLDPDIRVTTLGSGGTGHDIEGLTDTILTVAIMSLQANIQVFGRLRFIPDQDTRFYYFNCRDVEQHMKYHGLKAKLMQERAATFDIIQYYTPI